MKLTKKIKNIKVTDKIRNIEKHVMLRTKKIADDECGMGVVEVVLIILVLVGLAVIFKSNITSIVRSLLASVRSQTTNF